MTRNLYFEPFPRPTGKSLCDALKFILREVYGEPVDHVFTEGDITALRAIAAASGVQEVKKDVERLVEAIEKHDSVRVNEQ